LLYDVNGIIRKAEGPVRKGNPAGKCCIFPAESDKKDKPNHCSEVIESILSSDIIVLLILFLFSGFFSSAEAALLSLSDLHLHKMKSDNYPFLNSVVKLLEHPRRLLITVVTSNEAVNISISILAASLFISLFGVNGQWISIVVTSIVLFLAGEAIPKTFGVTYPMQI